MIAAPNSSHTPDVLDYIALYFHSISVLYINQKWQMEAVIHLQLQIIKYDDLYFLQ